MNSSILLAGSTDTTFLDLLEKLVNGIDLTRVEMRTLMKNIMGGKLSVAQIAAVIVSLRVKGEKVEEIVGAVEVMRELVTEVDLGTEQIVDLCGTGGDGAKTFNISTAAMFVVAGAGNKVAKHGGRAVSSKTGSADLLEAFGANINLSPDEVKSCIDMTGIGFMFAPNHHPAMRHVGPIRKELGIRSIFNILGPLTNPARAKRQLMGVFDRKLLRPLAEVLKTLGSKHVLLVHGENGLDEISIDGNTFYAELKENHIKEGVITPMDFGLQEVNPNENFQSIKIDNIDESKNKVLESLSPTPCYAQYVVALNAAAAIYVGGSAGSLKEGFTRAMETIKSGIAKDTLNNFVKYTSLIQEK